VVSGWKRLLAKEKRKQRETQKSFRSRLVLIVGILMAILQGI
jgi:hypothetical protein